MFFKKRKISESVAGSSELDDDMEYDSSEISSCNEDYTLKDQLLVCLDTVKSAGNFGARFNESSFVNPGLLIENLGTLPLPLVQRDAEAIINLSKRAPFGKKDETIIDTNIRRTWELDVTQFKCQNPAWPSYLEDLVKRAVDELGAQGEIEAQPYKLLIYEEGAFFKAHRDTEKVPGMFGTLVISLPSPHEGGEVHLSHSGKDIIFETSKTSAFNLCALSWYSDVKHEIKPITAGYRLVLTYNLLTCENSSYPLPSAQFIEKERKDLTECVQHWLNSHPENDLFIHPLTHQYTELSLRMSSLKGDDLLTVRYLHQVCSANEVHVFLASMTRTVEPNEDMYEEETEEDIVLSRVVTL
jgi:hypothetical protein